MKKGKKEGKERKRMEEKEKKVKERKKGKKEREKWVFINRISLEITVITNVYSYMTKFVG